MPADAIGLVFRALILKPLGFFLRGALAADAANFRCG
jgi:hypothetical protein